MEQYIWAGEVNFPINVTPGGFDLTGCTCTLLCTDPTGTPSTHAMTLTNGNKTATYSTSGTDLVIIGPWTLQVKILLPDGTTTRHTDEFILVVKATS